LPEEISNFTEGEVVPMPTLPEASMIKGVVSLSPVSSLTLKEAPVPKLVIMATVPAFDAPVEDAFQIVPVLAALLPVREISSKTPVKAVAAEVTFNPFPEVKLLAVIVAPVVVVPVKA
jgi:hypothetical protein